MRSFRRSPHSPVYDRYALLIALACCSPVAVAFSFSSRSTQWRSCSPPSPPSPPLKFQMVQSSAEMSESMERSSVKRFTVGYNKLCKNCPTRLQPRKDTLVEMIVGLPAEERNGLLAAVQQRLEEIATTGEVPDGLQTPMEVYKFQLKGSDKVPDLVRNGDSEKKQKNDDRKRTIHVRVNEDNEEDKRNAVLAAAEKKQKDVSRKMEKARDKLSKSETKLARVSHLLEVTTALLQKRNNLDTPALDMFDDEDDEEIDELRAMPRQHLKLQRLKYMAVRSKCERTRAKCRVKRYAASLDLARIKAQLVQPAG